MFSFCIIYKYNAISPHIAFGGLLGHKPDSKKSKEQTLEMHKDILKYLKHGQSVRNIMTLTKKSNGSVQKVKQLLAA
jgi:hypothetical protein